MKTTAIIILLIVVLGIGALALNKKKTEPATEGSSASDEDAEALAAAVKAEAIKNRGPLTNITLGSNENRSFTSATESQPKATEGFGIKNLVEKAQTAVKEQELVKPAEKIYTPTQVTPVKEYKEPIVVSQTIIGPPQKKVELDSKDFEYQAPILTTKEIGKDVYQAPIQAKQLAKTLIVDQPVITAKQPMITSSLSDELAYRKKAIAYYFGFSQN